MRFATDQPRAWLLMRRVLPLIAAGAFLRKQWSTVIYPWTPWPHETRSVDNAVLLMLLLALTAGLAVNCLLELGEWIYKRNQPTSNRGRVVVFLATCVVSGLSAWGLHKWIAQTEPAATDPRFSDDGGWELWGDYMDAYWLANSWRVAVIALILLNIGTWIALTRRHAADFKQLLLKRRASIAWAITGLVFIAALLLLPHHGWAPWWVYHQRPSWQPKSQFPHRYLSSTWWPLTLLAITTSHFASRFLLRRLAVPDQSGGFA